MIKVVAINKAEELSLAQSIRKIVFVDEQQVPAEDEIDEYEGCSRHYLAFDNQQPVGTARWRLTAEGVKLERFAVLKEAREKGVGSAILKKMLKDIQNDVACKDKNLLYLHSQTTAMFLYKKFGFVPLGDIFEECGIQHYKMVKAKGN